MSRNIRLSNVNVSKRGKMPMNGSHVTNSRGHHKSSSPTPFFKPLHSSDRGHQKMDENPFSHLALEVEMDAEMGRPSANPFDKGVMPSFDDHAIDEAYRNEVKKSSGRIRDDKKFNTKRPTRELTPPLLDDAFPIHRQPNDVTTTAMRDPIRIKTIPDVYEELDLDDFLPNQSAIIPSIDLKPQINIRSRNIAVPDVDVKPRDNVFNHKPVAEPVIESRMDPVPQVKFSSKPIVDYFGTNSSNESKQDDKDQKDEYFKESEIEANKILFGVEQPNRPLTNVEVAKRKKLILKLVDKKLKMKLSELMKQLSERKKAETAGGAVDTREHNDTFDVLENLVPDSVPDNVPNQQQNWTAYQLETSSEQNWNNAPNKDHQATWPIRPPLYQQPNTGWVQPTPMNPYPPGVDQMHNNPRFPGMPPMQPQWNPNQWHVNPHIRPPEPQWQSPHNWNTYGRPMNPHPMQPNMNLLYPPDGQHPIPNVNPYNLNDVSAPQISREKAAADIEWELKEKEFLERTLLGSKNKSERRKSPENLRHRSRPRARRFGRRRPGDRSRSRSRGERSKHSNSSPDRHLKLEADGNERLNRGERGDSYTSANRSVERILHRSVLSPSHLSPPISSPSRSFRSRSRSFDFQEFYEVVDQFESPICEVPINRSVSREFRRSNSRSEDLRVRLSQRRNKDRRSRSPADLRNKLLSDRSDSHRRRSGDLRNQLSERKSSGKRSRSHSRSRSRKRTAKSDADKEWIKFNNIVGMLMNIDRDVELKSEEMSEKKEIMRLLLENPEQLELDKKYIDKFGKSRLNLAIKEAENILYPSGMPDERTASLISKKIAAMSTERKRSASKQKETIPIEWIKLCGIIDQVLGLTVSVRKKLSSNDKRMIERDELLLKVSDDPSLILTLGTKYGHRNVEWANKFVKKILYHNGVRDRRVDETIAKERNKVMSRVGKLRQSKNSSERDTRSDTKEWNQLSFYVTKLVKSTLDKCEKMSRTDERRRDELLVQMSRDPDAIRTDTKFTNKIDKAELNHIIEKCKKLIASVKSNDDKNVIQEFEHQRTKLINILKSKTSHSTVHDKILTRISPILEKGKQTAEEKKEREALIEALIKDPESLKRNTKAIERIGDTLAVDSVIADIKKILTQLDPSSSKGPKKFHISSTKVIDIPFVVKITDASNQLNDTTKTVLLKALRDMITEIDSPPKPKLLQQRYIDKRVEVVCANLLTFEWLKRVIVSDFKDKWSGADLKIERVPVETKISRDKLKSVVVTFKDARAALPFDAIVDEIKKENPKLYPERWQLLDGRGKNGDYKKKTIGIDIESLAALEQLNRFARLGRSLVYFDISYMGDNIPNFEATCQ